MYILHNLLSQIPNKTLHKLKPNPLYKSSMSLSQAVKVIQDWFILCRVTEMLQLVDDLTCCSSAVNHLLLLGLRILIYPPMPQCLLFGVFTVGSIWQTGFATFFILFQHVLVDTVPTRCISILMAKVLPCTSPVSQ